MLYDEGSTAARTSSSDTICARIRNTSDLIRPELKSLYSLWQEKAGKRRAPARSDFDVSELVPWLPHILLSDYLDNGTDARFRVVGTWIVEQYGKDHSGKTASEIDFAGRSLEILSEHNIVANAMVPHRVCGAFFKHTGARDYRTAERLLLPLSKDGAVCDKFLTAIYFIDD